MGGDYFPIFLKAREGLPELKRFVVGSLVMHTLYLFRVPLLPGKFIIDVDDEVTLNYILEFVRRKSQRSPSSMQCYDQMLTLH